jgi:hypothetical protein
MKLWNEKHLNENFYRACYQIGFIFTPLFFVEIMKEKNINSRVCENIIFCHLER